MSSITGAELYGKYVVLIYFFGGVELPALALYLRIYSFFVNANDLWSLLVGKLPHMCFSKQSLQKTHKYEVSKGHHVLLWRVSYPTGDHRSFQFVRYEQILK